MSTAPSAAEVQQELNPRRPARDVALHVVAPLLLGGLLYLLYRPTGLWMFDWVRTLGLMGALSSLRELVSGLRPWIPDWLLHSYPDGCWVYAVTASMGIVWWKGPRWPRRFWLGVGPVLGLGAELGQAAGWVPGTFDWVDLGFTLVGIVIPLYLFRRRSEP